LLNVNCRPRIIRKVNPLDQIGRTGPEKRDRKRERGGEEGNADLCARKRRFIFIAAACCRKLPKRNPPLFLPSFSPHHSSPSSLDLFQHARSQADSRCSCRIARFLREARDTLLGGDSFYESCAVRPCGRRSAELEIGSIARLRVPRLQPGKNA